MARIVDCLFSDIGSIPINLNLCLDVNLQKREHILQKCGLWVTIT